MSGARYAIYFAPGPADPLWTMASAWLGRDAATGKSCPRPEVPGLDGIDIEALTADASHYGFHATLTAPFELAPDVREGDLVGFAHDWARRRRPFDSALAPDALGPFIAFRPDGPAPEIDALHEACVRDFHIFRAELSTDDLARRRKARLTSSQEAHLLRWGYPYVLDEFRFHMTLTGPIADPNLRVRILEALLSHFATVSGSCRFDAVSVFKQPARDAPFTILARASFAG